MSAGSLRIGIMARHISDPGGITVITKQVLERLLPAPNGVTYHILHRTQRGRDALAHLPGEHVVLPAPSRLIWDQVSVPRYAARARLDAVFNGKLSIPLACAVPTAFLMPSGAQFAVPWVYPPLDRLYTRVMVPRYAQRASAIITQTERGREDIVRYMGARPERIHVIPPGIQPSLRPASQSAIDAFRSRLGLSRPYVLFVGGITPLKNIPTLLRAFARVRQDKDVDLVLAGFRRWRFESDIRLIEELGLGDRVRQTGFVPDDELSALYSGAECLVMPSWYEGFGIPVVEAMACGTPVVSSNAGCLPEVLGGCAVLVDPSSADIMAAGIQRVIDDRSLRADLVARGLRHASQFTWERTTASIATVLESLALSHRQAVSARAHTGKSASSG